MVKDQSNTFRRADQLPAQPGAGAVCDAGMLKDRYFIVKMTVDTPLYEEGYINYGFNKIQYFEHLRLRGARLYIIAQSFAVDMPHPE